MLESVKKFFGMRPTFRSSISRRDWGYIVNANRQETCNVSHLVVEFVGNSEDVKKVEAMTKRAIYECTE